MTTEFEIQPILINGILFHLVELTDSALKHYKDKSIEYYKYIALSLNGQNRPAEYQDKYGRQVFKIASATTSERGLFAQSDYRDSCFSLYPYKEKIQFFHSSSIKKKQYDKLPDYMKIRIEEL